VVAREQVFLVFSSCVLVLVKVCFIGIVLMLQQWFFWLGLYVGSSVDFLESFYLRKGYCDQGLHVWMPMVG
jgi:hypothetical protein